MTSVIDDNGAALAVTLLSASPNTVTQIKTKNQDGYETVQQGFEQTKKPSKAQAGHTKNAGINPKIVREFRLAGAEEVNVGDKVDVESFTVGDVVDVTGVSKGKGFAGTIKR